MLRRSPRTGTPADWLVVGLGNPTAEYAGTRHNLGAETVEILVQRHGARLRQSKERAYSDEVMVGGHRVAFAIPTTWMNESGLAVAALARRHGVADDHDRIIVVQDELDLPLGVVRVKRGGGTAGHNGLRSIESHLHSRDFLRVRIGIGKPPDPRRGADHVLKRFSKAQRDEIDVALQEAADAVEAIITEGPDRAMTRVNGPR